MFTVASLLLAMGSIAVALPQDAAVATAVTVGPNPMTPDNAAIGQPCVITWDADPSGKWTQTNIELMTGQNQQMIHVTTVGTVDTTSTGTGTFTWPCPAVSPTSTIYWYQFSHALEPSNLVWTTRFAITGADGVVTPPQYATQPDGTAVPWGIGDLVDTTTRKPAPAYITGEIANPTLAGGAAGGASNSTTAAAATTPAGTTSATGVFLTSTTPQATTVSASVAAATTSTSGALSAKAGSALVLGAVGAVVALFVAA